MTKMLPKNPTRRTGQRASKTTLARLKAECDKLARQIVCYYGDCDAAGYYGVTCAGRMEWAHIKSRRFTAIRHKETNALCMCSAHHRHFHDHPDRFIQMIQGRWPDRLQKLEEALRTTEKVDYLATRDRLEKRLQELLRGE